ncbi:MAG TPA: GNAT family protein [Acidimicrobiales bacterium]|nr:GNAT family protein [Acidimicrobiales bacterium]
MPVLERLRANHASAVLAFELANRSYFAAAISDRGDEFFQNFVEHYSAQLTEQDAGACIYHVLVSEDGTVLGRFNLFEIHDGAANLGYRVAKGVAGRGVATATVKELCHLASTQYGLWKLNAAVSDENVASQRVLSKAGFLPAGPAEPGGRPGRWYERVLTDG